MKKIKIIFRIIKRSLLICLIVSLTGCIRKEGNETELIGGSNEESSEQNTVIVTETEKHKTDHPDEYYIKWAVPVFM